MTQSQQYQLNLWEPEDFVSLAQMNENFQTVEDAIYARQQAIARSDQHSARAAADLAKGLLAAAHQGAHYGDLENIILTPFQEKSDLSELSWLRCSNGLYIPTPGEGTLTVDKMISLQIQKTETFITNITVDNFMTLTKFSSTYSQAGGTVTFYLYEDGNKVRQVTTGTLTYVTQGALECTVNWPLSPNCSYKLYAVYAGAQAQMGLVGLNTTYSLTDVLNGQAVIAAKPINGKALRGFLRYTGTSPVMYYKLDTGSWTYMPPNKTSTVVNHQGASCKMNTFEVDFGSELTDANLSFKIALQRNVTAHDFCAVVL